MTTKAKTVGSGFFYQIISDVSFNRLINLTCNASDLIFQFSRLIISTYWSTPYIKVILIRRGHRRLVNSKDLTGQLSF